MRFTTIIASASVAAVLGLAGVSVAGAASNPDPAPQAAPTVAAAEKPAERAAAHKPGKALRRKIRRGAGKVVTETIGITRPELREALKSGKTIAEIATEHGVQPQAVIDALKSAATTKIDAAVAAGKIKAERAAKLKTRLDTAIPKLVNDWHK